MEFVDPDNVYFFGHSVGGVFAPLVARRSPPRAIVTLGTVGKPWSRYVLDAAELQRLLAGGVASRVQSELSPLRDALHLLLVEKWSPSSIRTSHPHLASLVGEYMHTRCYAFFQQLEDVNIPSNWKGVWQPTLVVCGEADYVAPPEHQEAVFKALSRREGQARPILMRAPVDHELRRVATPMEAFCGRYEAPFCIETMRGIGAWISRVAKRRTP